MERKWTPGPWKIGKPHPTNACLYIQPEGQYGDIATLYGADGDHQERDTDGIWSEQPIRTANAHLIAAAPDLYEALEYMRDAGCPDCNGDCASANPPVAACPMKRACAALAKARGEA